MVVGFQSSQAKEIWVTVLPQEYFVQRIAGDSVVVKTLVRSGQNPETYTPTPSQLVKLAQADAFIGIGIPVERIILPKIQRSIVHLKVFEVLKQWKLPIDQHQHEHTVSDVFIDDYTGSDSHVWMDPLAMVEMTKEVRDILIELMPENEVSLKVNAANLTSELEGLNVELQEQFRPYVNRAFYINHPSLGHFSARYGIRQLSIEYAGAAPSARRVAELIKTAKQEKVGAIFTQPEFGKSTASILARALRVDVVEVNPLASSYIESIREIANKLIRSFQLTN